MLYIVKSNSSWVFAYITLWKMVENGTSKYCKTNHNFASLKCDFWNIQHFCEYTTSWDTRTAFCFLENVGSMHEMPQYSNFYSFRCFEPWIRFHWNPDQQKATFIWIIYTCLCYALQNVNFFKTFSSFYTIAMFNTNLYCTSIRNPLQGNNLKNFLYYICNESSVSSAKNENESIVIYSSYFTFLLIYCWIWVQTRKINVTLIKHWT